MKNQMTILLMVIFAGFFMGACSSGGGGSTPSAGGGGTGGGGLSLTVLDDSRTNKPIAGVFVSIYETDNKTIAETKQTDANGVATFNVGTTAKPDGSTALSAIKAVGDNGRFTVTTAYEGLPGGEREIQTVFNLLAGSYTLFMQDAGCVDQGSISATFSVADAGASSAYWTL